MSPPPTPASPRTDTDSADREAAVIAAFVDLSDALVNESDSAEMLARLVDRCVQLLDVTAAGILLPDRGGQLAVLAASSSEQRTLEAFQLQASQGPCLDCVRTGHPVLVPDLVAAAADGRWPRWAARALTDGVRSAYALPMHLDGRPIGALNVFGNRPRLLTATNLTLGRALADVATAAVFSGRRHRDSDQLTGQLQHALDSRVVVEQAKGVLATALGTSVDDAFLLLRAHARTTRRRITDVAADLTTGHLGSDQLRR